MKKIYLVKREVVANSLEETLTKKGVVYEVQTLDTPVKEDCELGFTNKKNK